VKTSTVPPVIDFAAIRLLEARIREMDLAANTRVNYQSAWKSFQAWCHAAAVPALPASTKTVCDFITWCLAVGYRMPTVAVRISAIGYFHRRPPSCSAPDIARAKSCAATSGRRICSR
jgi:hypothetical protein